METVQLLGLDVVAGVVLGMLLLDALATLARRLARAIVRSRSAPRRGTERSSVPAGEDAAAWSAKNLSPGH